MVEYLLYRLGQFIVLVMPLRVAYWIAAGIAWVSYYFRRRARNILLENLRNAFQDWSEKKISDCARSNFVQFGKSIADFFFLAKVNGGNISRLVGIENREFMETVMGKKGRGVIALTAHLGSWELGGVTLALLGHTVSAVVLSHDEPKVDAIFVKQRARKGVRAIPVGKAGRESYRALIRGETVALVGDRDVTLQGVEMPFFGKPAVFPRGLSILALKTGAYILPGFMVRQKTGRYKLMFEKPFSADVSKSPAEGERDVMRRWISILEKYVRLYPEQWFMYHKVWDGAGSPRAKSSPVRENG